MWIGGAVGRPVRELAFAPDSRTLYTAVGNRIDAWDIVNRTNRMLVSECEEPALWGGMVASPDGRHLRFVAYKDVAVCDATTGAVVTRSQWPEHTEARFLARDTQFAWGYTFLASEWWRWDWEKNEPIRLTRLQWPDDLRDKDDHFSTALHPDGHTLAVSARGPVVVMFDLDSGAAVGRLTGPKKTPLPRQKRMAFNPDGNRLVVFGDGGYLAAFEWPSGQFLWSRTPGGRTNDLHALVFHPAGNIVAYAAEATPKRWASVAWFGDVNTGEPRAVPHPGFKGASCVAFSPDGLTCAVASTNGPFAVLDLDL